MKSKQQERTEWILQSVGLRNPYNRSQQNQKNLYYLYQAGYLASFLSSIMERDTGVVELFRRQLDD